jgi:hypothetical protein
LTSSSQKRITQYTWHDSSHDGGHGSIGSLSCTQSKQGDRDDLALSNKKDPSSPWKSLFNIFQQQQNIIINRAEQNIKHKLSFFDHAPAAVTIEEAAGN